MAGTYTEIVVLVVPETAVPGQTVDIEVIVKNIHTAAIYITVTGSVNGAELHFGGEYFVVNPGYPKSFFDSFVMPSRQVIVRFWSWYWGVDGQWHTDDSAELTVSPEGEPPLVDAEITKTELRHDSVQDTTPPAQTVNIGDKGIVYVWGKNNTSVNQKLGIRVQVTGPPNGAIFHDYGVDWEFGATAPGAEHQFHTTTFPFYSEGAYGAFVTLYVYPDSVNAVDVRVIDLGVVGAPSDLTGEITGVRIAKAPEGTLPIPATVEADGNTFEVVVDFKNTSPESYIIVCKPVVTDPLGNPHDVVPDRTSVGAGITAYNLGPFQFPAVNISGEWKIYIECALDDGTIIDTLGPVACLYASALSGEITSKLVSCGSVVNEPMPAGVLTVGDRFEFRIYFKNTCETSYDARIEHVTRYPDGSIAKSEESAYHGLPPGVEKIQDFNIVPVDRTGEWTTTIRLVNRGGEELDRYDGVCIIAAGPTGDIVGAWFNQGSHTRATFGSKIEADGQAFEVGVRFRSTTLGSIEPGVKVEVWDPDGLLQPIPPIDYPAFGLDYLDEVETTYQFGAVEKTGEWLAKLTLLTREGEILDEWPGGGERGLLFKVDPVATFSDFEITSFGMVAAGLEPITVKLGDTLLVGIRFRYTVPSSIGIDLTASLWIPPGVDYVVRGSISLDKGTDELWEGTIEVPITEASGLRNYTYTLGAELPAYGVSDQIDDAVTCTGMPAGVFTGIGDMIPMLIMVMMMSVMMNMMTGSEGFMATGAKYVEKGKEIAAPVIQIFTGKGEAE